MAVRNYCDVNSVKATISLIYPDGIPKKTIVWDKPPIAVTQEGAASNRYSYHMVFTGVNCAPDCGSSNGNYPISVEGSSHEIVAATYPSEWHGNTCQAGCQVFALVVDGVIIDYGVRSDFDSLQISRADSCILTIADRDGQIIYTKNEAPCPRVLVGCGDECPPGHCKCITNSYPGYCCLPCSEVAARINNLAARVNCG